MHIIFFVRTIFAGQILNKQPFVLNSVRMGSINAIEDKNAVIPGYCVSLYSIGIAIKRDCTNLTFPNGRGGKKGGMTKKCHVSFLVSDGLDAFCHF